MDFQPPGMGTPAMLKNKYPLPGSQAQRKILYRNRQRAFRQHGLDMSRHVIRAFQGMGIQWIIFRYQPVQPVFQVASGSGVRIFLNQQARRSVLQKQCAQTIPVAAPRHQVLYRVRNFNQTRPVRRYMQTFDHLSEKGLFTPGDDGWNGCFSAGPGQRTYKSGLSTNWNDPTASVHSANPHRCSANGLQMRA